MARKQPKKQIHNRTWWGFLPILEVIAGIEPDIGFWIGLALPLSYLTRCLIRGQKEKLYELSSTIYNGVTGGTCRNCTYFSTSNAR